MFCGGHESLGASLSNQGRHSEAVAALTQAVKLYRVCVKSRNEDEARALILLATAQAGLGDWTIAEETNKQAVEVCPDSSEAQSSVTEDPNPNPNHNHNWRLK